MRQFLSVYFLLFFFCSQAQNDVKSNTPISTIIVYLKESSISNELEFFLNQNNASLKKAISIPDDKIEFLPLCSKYADALIYID